MVVVVNYCFLRIFSFGNNFTKITLSMAFNIFMGLCNYDPLFALEHLNYPLEKHLSFSVAPSSPPSSPPLCYLDTLSVSTDLSLIAISDKWDETLDVLL